MSLGVQTAMQAVGSLGVFPSRAFIPAAATSVILKFGEHIPILSGAGIVETAGDGAPSWFTHPATVGVLCVLAFAELISSHNEDIAEIMAKFDHHLKSGVNLLTSFGVISETDAAFVVTDIAGGGWANGGFAVFCAGAVFLLAKFRNNFFEMLRDMDPDDSLGLHKLLAWMETSWAACGIVMLFLFPILMMVMTAFIFGVLWIIKKALERAEEKRKIECGNCGESVYPAALSCGKCDTEVPSPVAVGFFGQSTKDAVEDVEAHRLRLISKSRCSKCATRLKKRSPTQACVTCETQAFPDRATVDAYMAVADAPKWKVFGICFGLSLIPVLGVIPAILYYRLVLVSPYRRHIGAGRSFLAKWVVRILVFILLSFQWVPFLGALSLPLMAAVNFFVFRKVFEGLTKGIEAPA